MCFITVVDKRGKGQPYLNNNLPLSGVLYNRI